MFEKIGKFIVGYFLLMLVLPMLVYAPPVGIVVLVAGGVLFWVYRSGKANHPALAAPASGQPLPTWETSPEGAALSRLLAFEQRFEAEGATLARQLPEDPMDNPVMVELCSAYLHDPDERGRIEAEYQARRNAFLRWQVDARRLSHQRVGGAVDVLSALPQEYERLAARLSELQAYVDGLPARVAETRVSVDQALEAITRAAQALDEARAASGASVTGHAPPDADDRLGQAEEKLQAARAALPENDERPLVAARLAAEAERLAVEARERRARLSALPDDIKRRAAGFDEAAARTDQEIARAREAFEAAAGDYPPSCWLDIRGAGATAERDMQQAQELCRAALASAGSPETDAAALEAAATQLDEAFTLLEQASGLAKTITDHIKTIETAALTAREKVDAAEADTDRAWAWVQTSAGKEAAERAGKLLDRAAELTRQAREEMGHPQPDWLAIAGWAARSSELVAQVRQQPSERDRPAAEPRQALLPRKEQAKTARDHALALSWAATDLPSAIRVLLDQAEAAYQRALQSEAALDGQEAGADRDGAAQAVVDAYQHAEQLATAAAAQAQAEITASTALKPRSRGRSGDLAGVLVWGALGAVAMAMRKDD